MRFDNEQIEQLRGVMTEVATEVAANVVVKEIQASEKRVISVITTSVAEMIEDNILPQLSELRDDVEGLHREVAGLKSARWRLA